MRSQIVLGNIFGIRVGLHYSWFFISFLLMSSLFGVFHSAHADWSPVLVRILASTTAIAFFFSLLLHELAHALVAKARGLPVHEITLFALGGVSQINGESPDAKAEFWIAIVGPATSSLIGVICLGFARLAAFLDLSRQFYHFPGSVTLT